MKRLMGKYATREDEVDELLRDGVFVDLYKVVRQGFVVGTPSYSLKDDRAPLPAAARGRRRLRRRARWSSTSGGSTAGEPRRWQESPILQDPRLQPRSTATPPGGFGAGCWSGSARAGSAIVPASRQPGTKPKEPAAGDGADGRGARRPRSVAPRRRLRHRGPGGRLDELLGWLVEFHRREEKPMWWRMFERHDRSIEERFDDPDCLAGLVRTDTAAASDQAVPGLEYRFDPDQDTKLRAGSTCSVAGNMDGSYEITAMDEDAGLVELKVGPRSRCRDRICLIANEFVRRGSIKKALAPLRRRRGSAAAVAVAGGGRPAAPPPAADHGPRRRAAGRRGRGPRRATVRPRRPPRRAHPLHPRPARHRQDLHRRRRHRRAAPRAANASASPPTATR